MQLKATTASESQNQVQSRKARIDSTSYLNVLTHKFSKALPIRIMKFEIAVLASLDDKRLHISGSRTRGTECQKIADSE